MAKTERKSTRTRFKRIISVITLTAFIWSNLAYAAPSGSEIISGNVDITQNGNVTTITQGTDKAIINWQNFDIGNGETVRFVQPGQSSIALNRITSGLPTTIAGVLIANGQIWIINPSGILFTNTSQVDIGGLLATTSQISDQEFLNPQTANQYVFQSVVGAAGIINKGKITAYGGSEINEQGIVALVAPGVENQGIIVANKGKVLLASGTAFTFDIYGDQLIHFAVDGGITTAPHAPDGSVMNDAVANHGAIYAEDGQVLLTAKAAANVVDRVINMSGIIEAKSASIGKNGSIILDGGDNGVVQVSGKMDASGKNSGQKGGKVKVLGNLIALTDEASVDVSGSQGGGEILIGGNSYGSAPEITANQTFIGENVFLNAGAIELGDGGKITVWSDKQTQFYGHINTQGGQQSGNGGFVEVASKGSLLFNGNVNTTAYNGQNGALLLASKNIFIQNDLPDSYDGNHFFSDNPSDNSYITPVSLEAIIGDITLQANNDITFVDTLTLTSIGKNFTAQAGRSININAPIDIKGSLMFIANDPNAISEYRDPGVGKINLGASVTTTGGVQNYFGDVDLTNNITLTGNNIIFNNEVNGNHALNISDQAEFHDQVSLNKLTVGGSSVIKNNIITTGNQIYNGGIVLNGANVITLSGSQITFAGDVKGNNSSYHYGLIINGTTEFGGVVKDLTNLTINGATTFNDVVSNVGSLAIDGTASLNGGSISTLSDQIYGGAVSLGADTTLSSGAGQIVFNDTVNSVTTIPHSLILQGNAIFTKAVGAVNALKDLAVSGVTTIKNNITTAGAQTYTGAVTLNSTDDVTLDGSQITFVSDVKGKDSSYDHGLIINGNTELGGNVGGVENTLSNFTVNGNVTLNNDSDTTIASDQITFAGDVKGHDSSYSHGLNINGTTEFGGVVKDLTNLTINGATTFNDVVSNVGSLAIDGNASLNGGSISTLGDQIYGGTVTLRSDNTLHSNNGQIVFNDTVNSATTIPHSLTLQGNAIFTKAVGAVNALKDLAVSGVTTIKNNITTTGTQTYTGAVTLNSANDVTLDGSHITFASDVKGKDSSYDHGLIINGDTELGGNVGGAGNTLSHLTIMGDTVIKSGFVTTTGTQVYDGIVILNSNSDVILTGGQMTFVGDLRGNSSSYNHGLTINGTTEFEGIVKDLTDLTIKGATTFNDVVSNVGSLAIDGTASLNGGSISTLGDQIYGGAVSLGADTTLSSGAGQIVFNDTVNSATTIPHSLTLQGNAIFTKAVGAVNALKDLAVSGVTTIKNNITTTGTQTYTGAVTLNSANDVTLDGSHITFASDVKGKDSSYDHGLIINGNTELGGNVGGAGNTLSHLTIMGDAVIKSGFVTTTGAQVYDGIVILNSNSDVILTGGQMTFVGDLRGNSSSYNHGLTINGTTEFEGIVKDLTDLTIKGATTFNDAVSNVGSLSIDGTASLNGGSISTLGDQIYGGTVTLRSDNTLHSNNGQIVFNDTVNSATTIPHSLTLQGNAIFAKAVGAVNALKDLAVSGVTTIKNNITTTGTQTYTGAVTLNSANDVTLDGSHITFASDVKGNNSSYSHGLIINGATEFSGAIKDLTNLIIYGATTFNNNVNNVGHLLVNGITTINASNISTIGIQNYNGDVIVGANTNLVTTAGEIKFNSKVDSTVNSGTPLYYDLTINGPVLFQGAVGSNKALNSLTVIGDTTINSSLINTNNSQTYNGVVTLNFDNVMLKGSNVTFNEALDGISSGEQGLTIDGNAIFNAPVGHDKALHYLNVKGQTLMNTDTINTVGDQTYEGLVTLNKNITLNAGQSGDIVFNNGVSGASYDMTIDDVNNITSPGLITLNNFRQNNGDGLSSFTGGLKTFNNIIVITDNIFGYFFGNIVYLEATESIAGSVEAQNLVLKGNNNGAGGGQLTVSIINGVSGPGAADQAKLAPGSIGAFFVNGRLVTNFDDVIVKKLFGTLTSPSNSMTCIGGSCIDIQIDNIDAKIMAGTVFCVSGFATAIEADGAQRILMPGDKVYMDEKIVADNDSSVKIKTALGKQIKVTEKKALQFH